MLPPIPTITPTIAPIVTPHFDPFDPCNEPTLRDAANVRMRATGDAGLMIEIKRPQRRKFSTEWRSYCFTAITPASHKRLMNLLFNRHWDKFVATRAGTFWNTDE